MGINNSRLHLLEYFKNDRRVYYSRNEIAKHCTDASLWIVADQKVYDFTGYLLLDIHPGGSEAILKYGGGHMNAGVSFKHHSKTAKKKWKDCLIGYVKKE